MPRRLPTRAARPSREGLGSRGIVTSLAGAWAACRARVTRLGLLSCLALTVGIAAVPADLPPPQAPDPVPAALAPGPAVDAEPGVSAEATADVRRTAATAWQRVTAVWTSMPSTEPRLRLVGGPTALAAAVGRPAGGARGLVAIATSDQVYVDATAYLRLAPAGREVVLAHELTHLATGAASDPKVPVWLEEGFADYIGFLGAQIDVRTAAHAAISQVHAVGPPTGLPRDEDFAATGPALAVAYAEGWLMCRWFAQAYSQAALVEVYHRVAHGGTSLAGAVERVTGRPLADAVAGWAAYVTALAR